MPVAVGTRLSLAQVISSDPVSVRPLGSATELTPYANYAGALTIGQQVLTGFDESGRLVVFAQTTNPDYIPNTTDAVQSYNIADAAITREHILAEAIDRTKIAQGEVTAALIAVDAINETHISPEAITAPLIAANAIVGYHIVANSISASHISAYSITAQEIAAESITGDRILARTISADRIATGAITSNEIQANTITAADIETGTLTSASGVFGIISADDIQTGSLSADRISGGTITAGTIILNGAVLQSNNYNGDFAGADGWSMNNGNAVFNDVTIRGTLSGATGTFAGSLSAATGTFAGSLSAATGTFAGSLSAATGTFAGNLSGGTIDIGGADSSSFHVDSSGNMWLGASTFSGAASTFRVSAAGEAELQELRVNSWGRLAATTSKVTLSHQGIGAAAGDVELYATDEIFLETSAFGGGAIRFNPNGNNNAVVISPAGYLTVGVSSSTSDIQFRVFSAFSSTPVAVVWNQATIANTTRGMDIYLGADGNSSNPGSTNDFIRFRNGAGTVVGQIEGTGGGTAYQTSSDIELKDNITADYAEGAADFDAVPWRSFTWKEDGRPGHGVVAQELFEIPRWRYAVREGGVEMEPHPDTEELREVKSYWSVDYTPFIGALAMKIKQLEARLTELESV